ncbi:MAG TPA: hypothetical protein VK073_01645 [Pseudogracilibacillus sp.]|nr:hypothetical protein [Pseudogracilibacillus sp.]
MEQEKLKRVLQNMIDETENHNITSIKDMIQLLALEMKKAS